MNHPPNPATRPIQAREKLDFQLDERIPRFWNGGDPYKTRFFDAMSLTFPIGERYFISSVRAFRDQVTDPHLLKEVKDFTRQEAQHSMLHTQYNNRLHRQGINVPRILRRQEQRLFGFVRQKASREFTLGMTAASEAIAMREAGIDYACLSVITNFAAGISATPLAHGEVAEQMDKSGEAAIKVLFGAIERLP